MSAPVDVAKPNRTLSEPVPIRISEVLSALTRALDLSEGQPMGHSVRACVLGMRLAQEIGLPRGSHSDLYYALLMKSAGSSGGATAQAKERGAVIALRMGLSDTTAAAIRGMDEHGNVGSGEETARMSRILRAAQTLDVSSTASGPAAAVDTLRERSGTWFDPELVRAADSLAARTMLWASLGDADRLVNELEPIEKPFDSSEATLDRICRTFSEVIDAKTPFACQHSMGVAETAVFLARMLGLPDSEVKVLHRAALLHDIGKLGVSNSILEKPGKLTGEEWVELRKHAFYSYAILKRVPGFGELSEIAGSHHEKLDGSGYFRGLKAEQLSLPTRILVIADIYDALSSKRPYRDALPPGLAFQIMKKQAPHALDETCLDALIRSFEPGSSTATSLVQLSMNVQHS
jgi:putative nucleotidyltransferase with HDIG domain